MYLLRAQEGLLMRVRPQIESQPEWDIRFQGYAAKFIRENKWRLDPVLELDDHMSDAYLVFRNVLATYPTITDHKHIMGLFKIALKNDLIDRAKHWSKKRKAETSYDQVLFEGAGHDFTLLEALGEENNEGLLRVIICEMEPELQAALLALTDEKKMAEFRQPKVLSKLAELAGMEIEKETLN